MFHPFSKLIHWSTDLKVLELLIIASLGRKHYKNNNKPKNCKMNFMFVKNAIDSMKASFVPLFSNFSTVMLRKSFINV